MAPEAAKGFSLDYGPALSRAEWFDNQRNEATNMIAPAINFIYQAYAIDVPQPVIALYVNGDPVFYDCAQCGEKDAVMYGYIAKRPTRSSMLMWRTKRSKQKRPAIFCKECWEAVVNSTQVMQ